MSKQPRIMIHGKPFLSLGGQTHNSSSYVLDAMEPSWNSIRAIGANTMATPVPWDAFEPVEGEFNRKFVTDLIDEARKQGIKLSFLWFASWKNGTMEYSPAWVKRDMERFPRVVQKDGTKIHQLSAHIQANRDADCKAFCELIKLIKEYDSEERTVIAVQVENEAGILGGTRRDFGAQAQADFESPVPANIIEYCKAYPDTILAGVWKANGCKEGAAWEETFGYYGAEGLTAYKIASYIDSIAEAGKAIFPELFLYTNVWLDGGSRGNSHNIGGIDWPAGCATIHNVDIYYATCKYLDTIAPDNYQSTLFRHKEVTDAYANPDKGFPLYVPESGSAGINVGQIFYAFAEKGAIGYHIFGSESCLAPDGVTANERGKQILHTFTMLDNVKNLIFDYQDAGKVYAAVQEAGESSVVIEGLDGGWTLPVVFGQTGGDWPSMDFRHWEEAREAMKNAVSMFGMPDPNVELGRVLIFQESENVFYLVGHRARVQFNKYLNDGSIPNVYSSPVLMPTNVDLVSVTEGHFDENGEYQIDLVRSGDEVRHGIWCQYDCGVIRVELV